MSIIENQNIALEIRGVSKRYSKNGPAHAKPSREQGKERLCLDALKNVSFSVNKGDILGIVGRNGAGKSTLLKIISQITAPTEGKVSYRGNMVSILEVGTGFHPDLTGRENVTLSAVFHGSNGKTSPEVYREIVAFSGLEEFMDMPVKNYSSGMYLRLAFAVAFQSKVDILVVDEVLSVGDVEFRKKCYTRIREIAASGAAILIVSHNTNQIVEFCQRCIWLDKGQIYKQGLPLDVLEGYIEQTLHDGTQNKIFQKKVHAINENSTVKLQNITIKGANDNENIYTDEAVHIEATLIKTSKATSLEATLFLSDMSENRILMDSYAIRPDYIPVNREAGTYEITCQIPANFLNRGVYTLSLILGDNFVPCCEYIDIATFKIILPESDKNNAINQMISCPIRPQLDWEIIKTK